MSIGLVKRINRVGNVASIRLYHTLLGPFVLLLADRTCISFDYLLLKVFIIRFTLSLNILWVSIA